MQKRVVREIRTLRVMWRGLETGPRGIPELPRQFPTLPAQPFWSGRPPGIVLRSAKEFNIFLRGWCRAKYKNEEISERAFVTSLATGLLLCVSQAGAQYSIPSLCPNAQPVPAVLKILADLPLGEPVAFEKQLLTYFNSLRYRRLGRRHDKWVCDAGPYVNGEHLGVNLSVHSTTNLGHAMVARRARGY